MKKITAGLAVFLVSFQLAASESANKLVQKADNARAPQVQFSCNVKVIDDDGEDRKASIYHVSVKDERTSLVEQIAPERTRGRKLLLSAYDMWLYTPNMKRATRISMEQKLTGEVSNGDLARTNFSQDYEANEVSKEKIGSKNTTQLELIAKNKDVTYRKIHYWVESSSGLPIKAQFFALSGKLLKEAVYEDVKAEMGSQLIHKMTITDALRKNRTSTLEYSKYHAEKYSASRFSKESLDQD